MAQRLLTEGIDVILDQWDLEFGTDVPAFMAHSVGRADRVLMICTETYVQKVDEGKGGVGYEALIVCQEWGVMHKLLFGSDFPLWTPAGAIEALYKLNDQVEGTPLPRISRDALDELIHRDALAPLGLA